MAANPVFEIDQTGKEWRNIPGYEGIYVVSDMGEIKRISPGAGRAKAGSFLKSARNKKGYVYVCLCRLGTCKTKYVHVLVCEVFHGAKPSAKHQAAHRNDNKDDNRKDNLYWATPLQNHADRRRNGGILTGSQIGRATLKEEDIRQIFAMRESGMVQREIGEQFGVKPHTISRILSGKRWGHMGAAE